MKKIIIMIIIFTIFCSCNKNKLKKVTKENFYFNTYIQITVYNENKNIALDAINKAFTEIERIDNFYNSYKKDSSIYKLNENKQIVVDEELKYILSEIEKIYRLTEGNYDITIKPLIELWENSVNNNKRIPNSEEISEILGNIDFSKVVIDEKNILKIGKNQRINTGSFLKGYAIKNAKKILKENGINSGLITAVSSIETINGKNNNENWNIAIENPNNQNVILKTLSLNNKAVGVSGDYQNYYEVNGNKYHHILDVNTGFPINDKKMVVVIAEDSFIADIYSTALFTLEIDKILKIINNIDNIEVLVVDNLDNIYMSEKFCKFIKLNE
ncbi:MAG: FAD:protein FMN transferase [Fusobacteria bacterium]|nr:FAD:protein FMN transferase [Fusobacteriota bacterium]